jgi:hypothetical protein
MQCDNCVKSTAVCSIRIDRCLLGTETRTDDGDDEMDLGEDDEEEVEEKDNMEDGQLR